MTVSLCTHRYRPRSHALLWHTRTALAIAYAGVPSNTQRATAPEQTMCLIVLQVYYGDMKNTTPAATEFTCAVRAHQNMTEYGENVL